MNELERLQRAYDAIDEPGHETTAAAREQLLAEIASADMKSLARNGRAAQAESSRGHRANRRRRLGLVAVAAVILLGVLLVTPAFGIASSLLDLLQRGGQPPVRLTAVGGPWWSPDGKIVFASRRPNRVFATTKGDDYQLYVMNADGSGKQALLEPGDGPFSWSPDGRNIAFARNGHVYVTNADGSGVRRLTSRPRPRPGGSWVVFAGAWSPDGRKIAFVTKRDGNWEVYVMNPDGSGKRNLTRNPGNDGPRGWGVAWSPDGRKIAFVSDRDGTYDVYVMSADGSGQRRLTHRGS